MTTSDYKQLMRGKDGVRRTIDALKDAGLQVKVYHYRRYADYLEGQFALSTGEVIEKGVDPQSVTPKGGSTYVDIVDPDRPRQPLTTGGAKCWYRDNFNRKLGVRIALGRALSEPSHVGTRLAGTKIGEPDPAVER